MAVMAARIGMGPIIKVLQRAYKVEFALRAVCDEFAARGKSTRTSTVDRTVERTGLGRSDVIEVFRRFENLDLGKFLVGRRGQPSRMEWKYRLVDVGQAAAGELGDIEPADDLEDEDGIGTRFMRHSFQLRPDVAVQLELPGNLSRTEAARLADFIKTLPFE